MMHIGFDAKRIFHNHRGLGNYSRDIVRILSNRLPDHQYYLFTPNLKDAFPFPLKENCSIVQPNGFLERNLSSVWRTYWSCADIKRLNLDVYHGLSHELPVGIEKTRTKSVVTMHDVIYLKYPRLYPFIDRKLYKGKYLRSCRVADMVIAISEQTKRDLIEYAGVEEQRIKVVYQGCHPHFGQTVSIQEKARVARTYRLPETFMLHVGALEKRKNQALILEAMYRYRIDLPLVLVGKPTPYLNELKAFVEKKGLKGRVLFLTSVPDSDLPAIYQSSSLFLFPSLFEGFGIPILEALQSGVPVIASTGSCMEETGGDASCYINPNDADELGHVIITLLNDEERRSRMTEAGRRHARQFSDEAIAENLFTIYTTLLTR